MKEKNSLKYESVVLRAASNTCDHLIGDCKIDQNGLY